MAGVITSTQAIFCKPLTDRLYSLTMISKEDIITLPHESLRQSSRKVGLITPEIQRIIEDMKTATLDWEASRKHEVSVALAAVQINQLWRIVVVREDFRDKDNHTFYVLINPKIVKLDGPIVEDYEGCLSIKDVYARVPRHEKVKITALDENGKELRMNAKGFLARILQHEIDHTNGKVIIDHVRDVPDAFFRLEDDGKLNPLDYDKDIKNNDQLWN